MLFELPVELRSKIYARARYEAARDVVERLLTRRRPGGNPSMHLVEWRLSDTKRMALEHYTWGASTQHRVVVNVRDFARVYLRLFVRYAHEHEHEGSSYRVLVFLATERSTRHVVRDRDMALDDAPRVHYFGRADHRRMEMFIHDAG
jgi:hypothetical protein